ncbi:MAG: hypothetical protein GX235_03375 [Clostridiales bacterium]|nr:hypothetical protein [Clostridiales bacterium]
MKKTAIKCIYLAAVFLIALLVISAVANQGNTEMTMEMGPASYPIVHMIVGGREVNSLHGYKESMQCSYQRNSITPLGQGRKVNISVDKYGQNIDGLSFEVRSMDGERLVESTQLTEYEETEESIEAEFSIKDLIEEDTEYMLVLLLEDSNGRTIYYYTRIIQTENYFVNEKVDYVLDFHRKTFDKEAAKDLTKYLESNSDGDNTTFSKVTIHSSFNQVTWGDLTVNKMTEPDITIKEMASQTGALELNYIASIDDGKRTNLYHIKEFYRIRYTSDRIYLLDYERTMKQIFDEKADVFNNNKIDLGITSEESIDLVESDGGNVVTFTDGNRLYCYNITDNKLSLLFSFYNGNYSDERVTWNKHEIKILNVDEAGNVQFIVYGYMNRGKHEGEVGISVYHFSGLLNTIEELAYIPSNGSYEILRAEMQQLAYINKSAIFFFMHEGSIYAVNLENRTCEVMVSDLTEGSYKVSDSNRMVVWQTGADLYASRKLILMNLNTKEKLEISARTEEYIAPLGFMGEDLIYGLAKSEDVVQDNTGSILFPMYCIRIQNENGEVLKTYRQPDIYVVGSQIQGNQINLHRLEKDKETGNYTEISNDQIVNTKIEVDGNNTVESVATDKYEKIVQIAAKKNIDTKTLKRLTPKEVLFEGEREIALKESETDTSRYYVYGKNGVEGIFTDEGNAVNLAYDISGIVVNEKGDYIWVKGNRSLKNQIMAIKEAAITEEKNSLAVCLDTILQYEGVMRNSEYLLSRGENILDIMKSNLEGVQVLDLTGCSLDAILYYTNKDIPVLATLNDGSAVLITGFNELNTVLMDPLTGTIYKKGMNDSKQMFEENGNRFITYIRKE